MPDSEPILTLCRDLGFAGAGIADIAPSRWARELADWLAAGKHGSMGWLEENLALRLDPAKVLPGARAAILVADLYTERNASVDAPLDAGHGRIARYARGRDYHAVLKKRLHTLADRLRALHPDHEFRAFTDTAPVLERELAQRAGLGWIGKHTLLIHPRLGSYFFLGGLLTTLDLAPPPAQSVITDHCGTCTRCIDACPTQAITPHSVDASRCIAYLTIEHRAEIDPAFHAAIGDNLFGCDICQEVCPHNSPMRSPTVREGALRSHTPAPPNPAYAPTRSSFPIFDILSWTEDDRRTAFQSSALKRATLAMMKRNALIAAANQLRSHPDPALLTRIHQLAADPAEPDLVRLTAKAVLGDASVISVHNIAPTAPPRRGEGL